MTAGIKFRLRKTARTRFNRAPRNGSFDRDLAYAIIDSTPLCHIGHLVESHPVVTPTFHWRDGDYIYWHGSRASRLLEASKDAEVCLTVTQLDGLVLARSGFHHSANYRSVMIFGRPQLVETPAKKTAVLSRFIEGLFPGRWDLLRPISAREMRATEVMFLPIEEASVKMRTGPPSEPDADTTLPVWAGVIPVTMTPGKPQPCPHNRPGADIPPHVTEFRLRSLPVSIVTTAADPARQD
jgi:uncharacterized protein